jgi:UDP-galactopyranose mutase
MLNYDEKYFQDSYQYMPKDGFTKLFENMLDHKNIQLQLSCNAKSVIRFDYNCRTIYYNDQPFNGTVVYTGALDELLDYKFGYLPYRSLNLVFERYPVTEFQPAAVVNYPNEEEFTRITEFKYLTKQHYQNATTILKEYPLTYDPFEKASADPYYPISNEENNALYKKYEQEALQFGNLFLCGRLAEYKYYNMDMVVEKALALSEKIGEK